MTIATTVPANAAAVALPRPNPGAFGLVQLVNVTMRGSDPVLVSSSNDDCVGAATSLSQVSARFLVGCLRCNTARILRCQPQNGSAQSLLGRGTGRMVLLDVDGSMAGQGRNMLLTQTAPWLVNAGCTALQSAGVTGVRA